MGAYTSGQGHHDDVWNSDDGGISWNEVTSSAGWAGRTYHSCVVFNDMLYVLGGKRSSVVYNDVWTSVDGGSSRTLVTAAADWSARRSQVAVVYNDKIFVMGGSNSLYLNDIWNSEDGINWSEVSAAAAWSGRRFHTSVVHNDKIYVMGGQISSSSGSAGRTSDMWYSSNGGVDWMEHASDVLWDARATHSSVVFNDHIYVIGGDDNEVWSLEDKPIILSSNPATRIQKNVGCAFIGVQVGLIGLISAYWFGK